MSLISGTWLHATNKFDYDNKLVFRNPEVTIPQVANLLDFNPRGIAKHFKTFQDKGIIRRVGPDKGGHWEVVGE